MNATDKLIEAMRAGLQGVAPGPWAARRVRTLIHVGGYSPICEISISANHVHEDSPGDKKGFVERQTANAEHLARCSPDNIRLLLDTIASLKDATRDTRSRPEGLEWAVEKWRNEVENRPLRNVHRRSLDDTWRQVIRHFGGDDVALCGPPHDDLLAVAPSPGQDLVEALCEQCGRHVMAQPEPASGFIAACGRRLTRREECGVEGCPSLSSGRDAL